MKEAPTYTENQLFDEVREAYENLSKVEWQCIHTRELATNRDQILCGRKRYILIHAIRKQPMGRDTAIIW
jgi:hypothetical protein